MVGRVDRMVFTYHNLLRRSYFGHKKFLLEFGCISRTNVLKTSQLAQLQGISQKFKGSLRPIELKETAITKGVRSRTRE